MKVKTMAVIAFGSLLFACNNPEPGKVEEKGFKYQVDQFADCRIGLLFESSGSLWS